MLKWVHASFFWLFYDCSPTHVQYTSFLPSSQAPCTAAHPCPLLFPFQHYKYPISPPFPVSSFFLPAPFLHTSLNDQTRKSFFFLSFFFPLFPSYESLWAWQVSMKKKCINICLLFSILSNCFCFEIDHYVFSFVCAFGIGFLMIRSIDLGFVKFVEMGFELCYLGFMHFDWWLWFCIVISGWWQSFLIWLFQLWMLKKSRTN